MLRAAEANHPGSLLADDFRDQPYWWDAAAPQPSITVAPDPYYDVAIIGAGYTGLRAALTLLRAGRSVVVFDAEDPGFGASSRNAGFLGRVLKKSYAELKASYGREKATAVYRELDAAFQSTLRFIAAEKIECHAVRCGRFVAATSKAHYRTLEHDLKIMKNELGLDYHMVERADQHSEMGTELYHGGAVIPDLGSLHPGLYLKGLLHKVVAAGGAVLGRNPVTGIRRENSVQFIVTSREGVTKARNIVVATNGYTPRQFGWHARRIVPFTGYMAATQSLPPEVLTRLLPRGRTVIDTNMNIDFFRPAPDGSRLLFGGATGSGARDTATIAMKLHARLIRVYPELVDTKFSHIWTGRCAGTFDMMPHIGRRDGVWFGMGYNFAGVPMASYFGEKIANQILGHPEGRTIFEQAPFRTIPFYNGNPWFVPYLMRLFAWQDRRKAARP